MFRDQIIQFITELLRNSCDLNPFSLDESLIKSNRLDSISIVELLMFLEDEYGIHISTSDPKIYDQIDSVEKIVLYVDKFKQS